MPSLQDLAYDVLQEAGIPLHYKAITDKAVEHGLWPGGFPGRTPHFSLYRGITEEARRKGDHSRFFYQKGIVSLAEWDQPLAIVAREGARVASPILATHEKTELAANLTLAQLWSEHQALLHRDLLTRLQEMDGYKFESFAGKVLEALGFSEVEITKKSGDGGIDGIGRLEIGVVTVRAAFQMKRWKAKVGRPEVAQFRGDIQGTYDQGIVITTSEFTEEAKSVSVRPGTVPIVMIDGQKLVELLVEKQVGVRSQPLMIQTLDEDFFAEFFT